MEGEKRRTEGGEKRRVVGKMRRDGDEKEEEKWRAGGKGGARNAGFLSARKIFDPLSHFLIKTH